MAITKHILKQLSTYITCIITFTHMHAIPNPAAALCNVLGYEIQGGDCVFPDQTRCDQWDFWRGECGQPYHICTQKNGSLVTVKNLPLCKIDSQYYVWQIQKNHNNNQPAWTVVLTPAKTQQSTSSS